MEQHPHEQAQGPGATEAQPDPARRSFLKAAPLGALAVVAASPASAEAPATAAATAARTLFVFAGTPRCGARFSSIAIVVVSIVVVSFGSVARTRFRAFSAGPVIL
jgi:hypothetical protein